MVKKISREQMMGLRMGIPLAAMAVNSVNLNAQEQDHTPIANNEHQIEAQAASPTHEDEGKTFISDAEMYSRLQFDDQGENLFFKTEDGNFQNIQYSKSEAKKTLKEERQALREAFEEVSPENVVKTDTIPVTEEHLIEGVELGYYDPEQKQVVMRVLKYDNEFLDKFVNERMINNPNVYRQLSQLIDKDEPSFDDCKNYVVECINNINARRKGITVHELNHMKQDKNGILLPGISPEQSMILEQTNEISSNIAELLSQRDEYIKTGNIDAINDYFQFYKDAIKNKEIVPGSRVKEYEDKEFALIMNGTQKTWENELQDLYMRKQTLSSAIEYIDEQSNIYLLNPNDKELERREKSALSFEINDRKVCLYDYREKQPQVPEQYLSLVNEYYQQKFGGLSQEQLEKIGEIKSPEQLNKIKLEKTADYQTQKRKEDALKILEKQGRIVMSKHHNKSTGNINLLAKKSDRTY